MGYSRSFISFRLVYIHDNLVVSSLRKLNWFLCIQIQFNAIIMRNECFKLNSSKSEEGKNIVFSKK